MKCPVCSEMLGFKRTDFYSCPKNHGLLVSGKYLFEPPQDAPYAEPKHVNRPDNPFRPATIHCPNCSAFMEKVDYNSSGIIIDSCTNCPYRWLDAGELGKIRNRTQHYKPEDWQYLLEVDQGLGETEETPDINPRIPWFGVQRVWARGDSNRTLGSIASMSLYALVKAWPSKFMRYAILIIIIIFGLIYYVVIKTV